ncbi:hypothetical protein PIROE2DRAFT_3030 [Piromyces sp. E2]|nr:hypothetical protein PIROE2DRAFT_3030 [Piromyces sp. E2]|eukprot:OUM69133.1 hypothetical protein PIROE2DRAFT_3030 [Piromyces sp. E2]
MIISRDNIYVQTIIYGLIWAVVCFLFYNIANENNKNKKEEKDKKEDKDKKNNQNIINRIIIPEKYQTFGYPLLSFSFSASVFLTLKLISQETGYDYQKLIPSISLVLLIQCVIINLNEDNIQDENITIKKLSRKPVFFSGISIILSFYFCVVSMINTFSENKKGFLSYFGEALMKALNIKNPNAECQTKEIKKN